jgi:HEAT repeat protein
MQGRAFAGPAKSAPNEFVFTTRDRMDERYDMMRSIVDTRWLYIRNFRPDLPYVQPLNYMFKARGYQSWAQLAAEGKLTEATARFWGEKPSEELYDMEADPDNVNNLVSVPEHRATLEKMRARLRQRMVEIKDNGLLPEGSVLEGYDASRAPGAWPIEQVVDLAILASERNAANLPKFIEALGDESEPVRWWAAQGCTILREKAASAESALRQRLEDKSGAVAVAAAEALARLGNPDAALRALERWVESTDNSGFIQLAANVLDRLGEIARPALPTMKRALESARPTPNGTYPPQQILNHAIAVLEARVNPLVYPPVSNQP